MATKEEHLWRYRRLLNAERHGELLSECRKLEAEGAERETTLPRVIELERELKNAREAHGIAEQKADEMVEVKPPAFAEVEGPFKYNEVYGAITSSGKDVAYTSKSFADPDCLIRLLNLGVKSEELQAENAQAWAMLTGRDAQEVRDGISLLSVCTQVNARRDALETLEIAARRERDNETFAKEKHKLRADAAEAREKKASDELHSERRRMCNIAESVGMAGEYEALTGSSFHGKLIRRLIHLAGAEAREKALLSAWVELWDVQNKEYEANPSAGPWCAVVLDVMRKHGIYDAVRAKRSENHPADQAPEATEP